MSKWKKKKRVKRDTIIAKHKVKHSLARLSPERERYTRQYSCSLKPKSDLTYQKIIFQGLNSGEQGFPADCEARAKNLVINDTGTASTRGRGLSHDQAKFKKKGFLRFRPWKDEVENERTTTDYQRERRW